MSKYISYDLVDWGQPFEKQQKQLPEPTGAEVLVKVTAAGLCHSDLHIKKGYMDLGELGTFELGAVDRSWASELILGAIDYYDDPAVPVLQLRPESPTIDVPDMAQARADQIYDPPAGVTQARIDAENSNRFAHTICISAYG